MKILIATEYFPESEDKITGGVEARAFYLGRELSKEHEVEVICSWRKGLERESEVEGMKVKRVGPRHGYSSKGYFFSRLRFSLAVYREIKKREVEVVDGFNFTTYIPSYFGGKKIKAKKVATYHETWLGEWIRNKGILTGLVGEVLERMALSLKWDLIIPVSNFTREKLREKGVEKEMKVVYNGVNLEDYKVEVEKPEEFRIVCVSRLLKTKRIQVLLRSLKKLKGNFSCVVVGKGEEEDYFKNLVEELGLEEKVKFTGFLESKEEVVKEMKKGDVFCLPSAVEGFGIVVVEAMASGVPVVCSDIEPLKEVTGNGKYGLLFKLDDADDLAEKINLLREDEGKRRELREKGLKRAKEFSWEKIAKKYVGVLR